MPIMEEQSPQSTSKDLNLEKAPCYFTRFPLLPPELRQAIWGVFIHSLPDKSELLIHEPSDFPQLANAGTPTVYTGYPTIMHVNQEARYIAQMHTSFVNSPSAQCMVPVRPFRPELDVLYIPREAWRTFFLFREFHYGDSWLSQLQHVAVDFILSTNPATFFRQVRHIPAVRTLRFVLASEEGPFNPSSMLVLPKPITRCALRQFPGDRFIEIVHGRMVTTTTLAGYLNIFDLEAVLSATEVLSEAALDDEFVVAIMRCIDIETSRLKLKIIPTILTEYRHSQTGSGFVEMGKDNVADLVLPFT
ncbi:hypothetical protein HD806DRAFT_508644 [Xylariaceae sp. AK1471]|nr:hypothetical protein HD806DRAFT_508644 [Xylariaceae sp. AK1471]